MNRQLTQFAESHNLEIKDSVIFGEYNNYHSSFAFNSFNGIAMCKIYSLLEDNQITEIESFLQKNKKTLKYVQYQIKRTSITFTMMIMTYKSFVVNVEKTMEELTTFLSSIQVKNAAYCPACGDLIDIKNYVHNNDTHVCVDTKCASQIQTKIDRVEEEYQASPNNYGRGTLGALVGALIGGIVWIIVGLIGFVSAYVAILVSFLAGIGYDKMKGKASKVKLVIISVISMIVILASMYLLYVIIIQGEMSKNEIEGSPFEWLHYILANDPQSQAGFIKDMVLSVIFGGIGVFAYTASLRKKVHK